MCESRHTPQDKRGSFAYPESFREVTQPLIISRVIFTLGRQSVRTHKTCVKCDPLFASDEGRIGDQETSEAARCCWESCEPAQAVQDTDAEPSQRWTGPDDGETLHEDRKHGKGTQITKSDEVMSN